MSRSLLLKSVIGHLALLEQKHPKKAASPVAQRAKKYIAQLRARRRNVPDGAIAQRAPNQPVDRHTLWSSNGAQRWENDLQARRSSLPPTVAAGAQAAADETGQVGRPLRGVWPAFGYGGRMSFCALRRRRASVGLHPTSERDGCMTIPSTTQWPRRTSRRAARPRRAASRPAAVPFRSSASSSASSLRLVDRG